MTVTKCTAPKIGRIATMGRKQITTTREDDDRAIRSIEVVMTERAMVEGQLQHDLLTLVIRHIRNTREYVDRLREEIEVVSK